MNLIGKIIGNRYEILEEVGLGGMATVYKAKDHVLNRLVAVKVLKDEFTTDTDFIKRFNTEAQAAASLSHPNIVSIYDVGHEDENNLYYIVMELVQGKTLKEIINDEGALSWKWAVNIAMQIASALELAHKNGIIHRDIKPHNIIITEDGIAKVTDFGIAKAVSNSTITAFGTTIGSVHYFSPEQAKGGFTDAKSDLYSLGVVMYEMLTGKVPFDADTPVSVALKHMQEDPKEPIELNPEIPTAVNQIVMKAMQKEPSARYQSATEMLHDLSKALKDPDGDFVIIENKDGGYTRVMQAIKDDQVKPKNGEEVQTKTNFFTEHPKAKIAIIILSLVLLFVVVFLITKIAIDGGIKSKVDMPNLVGKTQEEAEQMADDLGLTLEVTEVASSDVEEGKVVSQDPEFTESKIEKGSTIKINVSKGPEQTEMVKLEGMKIEDARNTAESMGIKLDEQTENSDTVEAGIIIKQDTPVGTLVKSGDTVVVHISAGVEKVRVPTVLGMDEGTAVATLKNAGLNPKVTYESNEEEEDGKVISQSIDANAETAKNSNIDIVVNKIVKEQKTINVIVDVKSIIGSSSSQNTNTTNETAQAPETVNVTILIDGVERTQNSASVNNSSYNAYSYTSTGIHDITVKVGSSYTKTRTINFDESDNNRNVIFDKNTVSD